MAITKQEQIEPAFDPPLENWPGAGVYQLWIELSKSVRIRIGALGPIQFCKGRYVYTGRASRGLRARVLRHVNGARRRHWHIDHLLAEYEARIAKVSLASLYPGDECSVNQSTGEGMVAVPKFGASDCRVRCETHLWRVGRP